MLNHVCFTLKGYGEGAGLSFRDAHKDCEDEALGLGGQNGSLAQIKHDGVNCKSAKWNYLGYNYYYSGDDLVYPIHVTLCQ